MVEKQLLATYFALQAVEPITQTAEVIVKTTLPIQGWVKDLTHIPKTGVAQSQTVAHWVTYLSQRSHLSSSPLKEELQKILGPVTYHSEAAEQIVVTCPEKRGGTRREIPYSRRCLVHRWIQHREPK